jgi:hypothetical protein
MVPVMTNATECATCGYVNGHWRYCPGRDRSQDAPRDADWFAAYDAHQAAEAQALLERTRRRR